MQACFSVKIVIFDLQISLALLLGSDYSQGVYGFGPVSSEKHLPWFGRLPLLLISGAEWKLMLLQLFLWPQESACQVVKSVGEETILQKIALERIPFAKKSRNSRKQEQLLKCNDKENCSDHEINTNGKIKIAFH